MTHTVRFDYSGNKVVLSFSSAEDHLAKEVTRFSRFYEAEMLESVLHKLPPNGVFLDIGANIGNHTVCVALSRPDAKVFAFEPNPEAYTLLERNVEQNHLVKNVTLSRYALGRESGKGAIALPDNLNLGMARVVHGVGEIEILDMDNAVAELELERCDVIKIDVEGMELEVLQGAEGILSRFHPALYIECQHQAQFDAVSSFLSRFGYASRAVFNATPTYLFESAAVLPRVMDKIIRKIVFFAGDEGNFHFAESIVTFFRQQDWAVYVCREANPSEQTLADLMTWADVAWFEWANGPIVMASRMEKRCKIVCRVHRYEIMSNVFAMIDWGNVDDVVFISAEMAKLAERLHGLNLEQKARVHVVGNVLGLSFPSLQDKPATKKIAYVARFVPEKNIPLMLQIMQQLMAQDAEFTCHVLGRIQDMTTYLYFEKFVTQAGLQQRILYEGTLPAEKMAQWYQDKSHILSTSIVESEGLSIVEGMVHGLRPVIHDCLGGPTQFFDEQFVYGTVDEAVQLLLEQPLSPQSYQEMARHDFDPQALLANLERIVTDRLVMPVSPWLSVSVCNKPLFSVIIPAYNREHYIREAVFSVLNQNFDRFELIVVDDGSTDGTADAVAAIDDPRLILIRNRHAGAPVTRNTGIQHAKGEYIVWLGSDDILVDHALATLAEHIVQYPEADVLYGDMFIFQDGQSQGVSTQYQDYYGLESLLPSLVRGNCLPDIGEAVKNSAYNRFGLYDESFVRCQDYELWTRFADAARFKKVPSVLAKWRQHGGNLTNSLTKAKDYRFEVKVIASMLERYDLARLFPDIDIAAEHGVARAQLQAAVILDAWKGYELAAEYARKALDEGLVEAESLLREVLRKLRVTDSRTDFTVIMPTFNRPDFLMNAIKSVQAQTHQNYEIIVVNDGGCDVEPIITMLNRDGRIQYIRQKGNFGLSAARNAALKVAKGRYIVHLDDDDMMLPTHLETLYQAHKDNPNAVVYTNAYILVEEVDRGVRKELGRYNPYQHDQFDKFRIRVANYLPVSTWSYKYWMYEQVGGYDETLPALEDWDLLLRLAEKYDFVHIQKTTMEERRRPPSLADNMCTREAHRMHDLHLRFYQTYGDGGDMRLREARARVLEAFPDAQSAALAPAPAEIPAESYAIWRNAQQLTEIKAETHAVRMLTQWKQQPLVTLFTVVDSSNLAYLAATVDGLQKQLYKHWRLIVLSDLPCVDPVFQQSDFLGWMELSSVANHGQVAQALNAVLGDLPCDWVALIPPGTVLAPEAMLQLGDYAEMQPKWSVIYTDHDTMISEEDRVNPQFKPDFNLDMLLAKDYVGAALWFRFDVLARLGGFPDTCYAFHYDLVLQAADAFGDSCIGHIAYIGFSFPLGLAAGDEKARIHAVSRFLARNGLEADILPGYTDDSIRIDYHIAEPPPHVSIIIPTQERLEYLEPCIASILNKTSYPVFDIVVVDGGSEDPDLLAYYDDLAVQHQDRVSVISMEDEFDLATAYRAGIAVARGGFVLLMANDTECVQAEWLSRLVSVMQRADVGAAGPRLLMPESAKVFSAGLILGVGGDDGVAGHAFQGEDIRTPGYMSRALLMQSYSALAADCLLLSRAALDEVGGLLDVNTASGALWNVDLGLRLIDKGYRLVFTPFSNVVTQGGSGYAPASTDLEVSYRLLKQSQQSAEQMLTRWRRSLAADAAYSRHLSLVGKPFDLEVHASATWDRNLHDKPRLLGVALAGGSGVYRLTQPFAELSHQGQAHGTILKAANGKAVRLPTVVELERMDPDTVYFQNSLGEVELRWLEKMKGYRLDTQFICSLDDLIVQIPAKSSVYYHFQKHFRDAKPKLRRALALFDRLVVSTQPLADYCRDMIDDIVIVPNALDREIWGDLTSQRGTSRKPRVGWVGAQQHLGDLTLVFEVVKALADEVDWVFMGMCPDEIRPYVKEAYTDWVAYEKYPAKMASLNLDLAIAPLEINSFNEAKSNLRLLEYGALGWPVVCSDIYPYRTDDAPVTRVPNTTDAWLSAIRDHIQDMDASYAEGDKLRHWVQRYWLDERIGEWFDALNGRKS